MNAGAVSERVYAGVKRRILDRQYRPGDRLDPAALGDALSSSVTPVRDALHRLAGERLVEARTSEGFYLPRIDVAGLGDLYAWAHDVALIALRSRQSVGGLELPPVPDGSSDAVIVTGITALFTALGEGSPNLEHRATIASVNDRLHAARLAEIRVLPGLAEELAALRASSAKGSATALRYQITAYFRRRRRRCDEIVRTLYRNGTAR